VGGGLRAEPGEQCCRAAAAAAAATARAVAVGVAQRQEEEQVVVDSERVGEAGFKVARARARWRFACGGERPMVILRCDPDPADTPC
jgi:hypothetical protein